MKKRVTAALIIATIVIVLGGGYLLYDFAKFKSDYDPIVLFRDLVSDPIPGSVCNIQGDAVKWLDLYACLRFNASEDDIKQILNSGFVAVLYDEAISMFQCPDSFLCKFDPPWSPEEFDNQEYYEKREATGNGHSETKWLILNRSKSEVYFVCIGT